MGKVMQFAPPHQERAPLLSRWRARRMAPLPTLVPPPAPIRTRPDFTPAAAFPPAEALSRDARIRLAFEALPPNPTETRVLRALAGNPGRTSRYLSEVCGWRGKIWHTHLAAIAHKRFEWLWPDGATPEEGEGYLYGMMAEYDPETSTFTMQRDAEAALTAIGLLPPQT